MEAFQKEIEPEALARQTYRFRLIARISIDDINILWTLKYEKKRKQY